MLTRTARKHQIQHFHQNISYCFQQLQLPWLCPAVHGQQRESRRSSSASTKPPTHRSTRRSTTVSGQTKNTSRSITTDVAAILPEDEAHDYIPFQGDLGAHYERYRGERTKLRPWDPNAVVQPELRLVTRPPVIKRPPLTSMPGDMAELLPNLYACIQVGRMDRAAKLVIRLSKIFQPDAPELLDAHQQYLLGLLDGLLAAPTKERYEYMERWLHLEVRAKDVKPDSRIIAIMLKGALSVFDGTKLDRTLRKYLAIAEEMGDSVRSDAISSELFSQSQMARLVRLMPQDFNAPNDDTFGRIEDDKRPPTFRRFREEGMLDLSADGTDSQSVSASNSRDGILPALKRNEIKGWGLKSLEQSLISMYNIKDDLPADASASTIAYERQRRLEADVTNAAMERWREEFEESRSQRASGKLVDPVLGVYAYEWLQQIAALVKEEIKLSAAAEEKPEGQILPEDGDRLLLGPFLRRCDPEQLTACALMSFASTLMDPRIDSGRDRPLIMVVNKVGIQLTYEIMYRSVKPDVFKRLKAIPSNERRKKLAQLLRQKNSRKSEDESSVDKVAHSARDDTPVIGDGLTSGIRIKLGAMFVSMIVKVAKIPVTVTDPRTGVHSTEIQSIATHSWVWKSGKRVGVIRVNPDLLARLKREPVGGFIGKTLPMLCQPGRWRGLAKGPYISTHLSVVRLRDSSRAQEQYLRLADQRGDLTQLYAALDVIGMVPWKINQPLFKILAEAWNTGEAFAKLAPQDPEAMIVRPPKPPESDWRAVNRWRNVIKGIENRITGFHSQRCYQNFQLEVARAFAQEEVFYCPHNVDFRGRAYPIPPYFNHMGADYVRGLFLFSTGKKLGDKGLEWLKIHLANMYGYDKERLKDRERFAMDHLTEIYDSAENPLTGRRWWLTGGHPWQLLAACMELKNALDSPIPTDFVSHLPIQQDGTCNGLQHYAALGGDVVGAKQVNLMPGDRPADIYSAVADFVKADVSKAAAEGNRLAQILDGKITRKVVKQPVMTNVYGVTYYGAKEQVAKQLIAILDQPTLENDINIGQLSAYVAGLIFSALSRMFNGAQAIQQWLGECGARISSAVTPEQIERIIARRDNPMLEQNTKYKKKQIQSKEQALAREDYQFKSTIVWTTPLGLPVVQPYRKAASRAIKTGFQDVTVEEPTLSDPVSKRRQLQAFPPNFIHSLDASHMMLSALKCNELGTTFASVHDSFWTHACDVQLMNRVLRDAFVLMHSEDIIGRLREEFVARYKGCFYYTPISASSPVAKKINAWRQERGIMKSLFTRDNVKEGVQIDELLIEYKRFQLLNSNNPEEQKEGKEMITPAALFEAVAETVLPAMEPGAVQLLGTKEESPRQKVSAEYDTDVPGSESAEIYAEAGARDVTDAASEDVEDGATSAESTSAESKSGEEVTDEGHVGEQDAAAQGPDQDKQERKTTRKKSESENRSKMYLWMPISFPETPTRGAFDVRTLKDSVYFFS